MKMQDSRIVGIYLAAGKSSRMGENKLLLPLKNTTLGSLALNTALTTNLDHIVVVTKEEDPLDWLDYIFFTSLFVKRWTHVTCAEAKEGQAYSLRRGLQEVNAMKAEAVLVFLADQPFVTVRIMNNLIARYRTNLNEGRERDFVAASFKGIVRPPILFSRNMFPALEKLEGDMGARKLIRKSFIGNGDTIEYEDERAFFDIDTREEYEQVKEGIPYK